jgi:hypothetical protein
MQCAKMKGKSGGLEAITAKTNCVRDLAQQKSHNNMPPDFNMGLPLFRQYETCMLRTLYLIGGNSSKPHTEFMNNLNFSYYHNACFSEVEDGMGLMAHYLYDQLSDLLICNYELNDNIPNYLMKFGGVLQIRICRHINYNSKGIAVSFTD